MKKQMGLTLVEITVVMVIVGLLLGGVLKIQEIVTNAKIKNVEGSFDSLAKAIFVYQERYNALPGDDKQAKDNFGFTLDGTAVNGNANGIIDKNNNKDYCVKPTPRDQDDETGKVWLHLRAAKLIAGSHLEDDDSAYFGPVNAFNGATRVDSRDSDFSVSVWICFTNIPSIPSDPSKDIALLIDQRQDDGNVEEGRIQTEPYKDDKGNLVENAVNLLFSL